MSLRHSIPVSGVVILRVWTPVRLLLCCSIIIHNPSMRSLSQHPLTLLSCIMMPSSRALHPRMLCIGIWSLTIYWLMIPLILKVSKLLTLVSVQSILSKTRVIRLARLSLWARSSFKIRDKLLEPTFLPPVWLCICFSLVDNTLSWVPAGTSQV